MHDYVSLQDNVAYNQIGDPFYKAQSIGGSVSIWIDNLLACHSIFLKLLFCLPGSLYDPS